MNSLRNPASERFNRLLKTSLGAVHLLDERGITIRNIRLDGAKPVIEVDPPTDDLFLRGALRSRVTFNNVTRTVLATVYRGCQVEWEITEQRALSVAQGGC